jgi:hypothetical protein
MEAALFTLAAAVLILTTALVVLAGSAVTEFARLARTRLGHEMLAADEGKKASRARAVDAAPAPPERPVSNGYTDVPGDMDGA